MPGRISEYHPQDPAHTRYWRAQKKYCIEGVWGQQDEKYRYMPGRLYFYGNFGRIIDTDPKEKVRRSIKPRIDDIEWERAYMYLEAEGFSGWQNETTTTSDRRLFNIRKNYDPLTVTSDPVLFKSDGKFRDFIEPRENIRMLHDTSLGTPLYNNQARNIFELGSRGGGKSYFYAIAGALYRICFDGIKYYTEENRNDPPSISILIGSGRADKSSEFCAKIEDAMNALATDNTLGAWGRIGDDDYEPSPFYKDMKGTLKPNNKSNPWKHEYSVNINGRWVDGYGTQSKIFHVNYSPNKRDGAEAGAGGRYTDVFYEEVGLCFARDTLVRMYDTSVKPVQDIRKGDLVMGHDGTPRTVAITSTGTDRMYKVSQRFGTDYTVNSRHKLYVDEQTKVKARSHTDGIKTIEAKDFNSYVSSRRRFMYGCKNYCLNFPDNQPLLDPYYLGAWLGDGKSSDQSIFINTEKDPEILHATEEYATIMKCRVTEFVSSTVQHYNLMTSKGQDNPIRDLLRHYDLLNNKHIPADYLKTTEFNRLALLAGLIDTDGYYGNPGKTNQYYEIGVSRNKRLVDQIEFLVTSLGFRCMIKSWVSNKGYGDKIIAPRTKYKIKISGDIWRIPCKVERKIPTHRKIIKDFTRTPIKVKPVGTGTYYGFQLEENPLFLLADGTIVHNTELAIEAYNSNRATVTTGATQFGVQVFLGTSGNMDTVEPARQMFTHPDDYDILPFQDVYEAGGDIGFFLPAAMTAREFKDDHGNTDLKTALEYYTSRRERASTSDDPRVLRVEKMNYPNLPTDMWQTSRGSILPAKEAEMREKELMKRNAYQRMGNAVRLYWDKTQDNKVDYEIDHEAMPFFEWPIRPSRENYDGAVLIYDHPITVNGQIPKDAYFATHDPYVTDEMYRGASLGATHVWLSPQYWTENMTSSPLVATYIARPSGGKRVYYDNLEKLLAYYGNPTRGLWYEADRGEYCREYFIRRKKSDLLSLRPLYVQGDNARAQATLKFGFKVGNKIEKIAKLDDLSEWLKREIEVQGVISRIIHTLPCIFTVRQIRSYNTDDNFDAISSILAAPMFEREQMHLKMNKARGKNIRYNPLSFLSTNKRVLNYEHHARYSSQSR